MNPVDTNMTMFKMMGSQLESLQQAGTGTADEAKLKKAAQDFEAVFLSKLFKEMDKTVERSGFLGNGKAEETFKSMMFNQIAQDVASNPHTSMGFAQQVYEQMKDRI